MLSYTLFRHLTHNMNMKAIIIKTLFTFLNLAFTSLLALSQVNDTIANWDGTNVDWAIFTGSAQQVDNPLYDEINSSAHCMQIVTNNDPYNFIFTDFSAPVNFENFPVYRLKILAPEVGGSLLLKFENGDNSSSVEVVKTQIPGEWNDLEFDFTGLNANDYTRMAIFFDFQGTTGNQNWYLDDIIGSGEAGNSFQSNLPIVIINTNGTEINNEYKIDAFMGIIDNGSGQINHDNDSANDFNGQIGIDIRGQSSQMFPKKSFSVETRNEDGENLNVPLLGMPEENDWILYAPFTDKSMLRNYMTFYLAKKLDHYSTRTAFCELILNYDYRGVYILMEKIKRDKNRVNIAKLNPEDTSGDELTGGYIIKVDKIDPDFVYGQDGWLSVSDPHYPNAMNITFQYYDPKPDELLAVQKNYIHSYITNAENTLTGINFTDPNNGFQKYINSGSFIDQMLLNEISKEVDKYRYSTYFYKEKDSDGGKLFAGPPWDFNLGYSNVDYWPTGNDYTGWLYSMVESHDYSIMFWWKRMMEDSYFQNLAKTRWQQLRQNEWSDDIIQEQIDSVTLYIDDAQTRNYERWPILGEYVWPNYDWQGNDYNDEVAFFQTWLFNRLHWIDENIQGNILYPRAELSGNLPYVKLTLFDDYFSRNILKKKYFQLNNNISDLAIDTIIFINTYQALVKISGTVEESTEISVTMKSKILNSFEDLTSSTLAAGNEFSIFQKPEIKIYKNSQYLHLDCSQPELLGDQIEIYTPLGQLVQVSNLENNTQNKIEFPYPNGVYLCRFSFNNQIQSQAIRFVN